MKSEALRAVLAARTALVLDNPFFGSLALRLTLREDPSCDTAWTDGQSLGFNPAFVLSLSQPRLVALMAHEVMHVASGHPWRRDGRDPKRANIAMDYAINGELKTAGFDIGPDWLLDSQFTGKAFEWIFDRLPATPEDPEGNGSGTGSGTGDGVPGEVRDAPEDADAPTEQDWKEATRQAAAIAKARGELAGGMDRFAKNAITPAVDWRSVLHRFMTSSARADYTWTRPARRYLPAGLYLPGLHSNRMGRMVVAVDTSGSVDDVLLSQFGAEISAIASELSPESIDVVYCDARINRRETFEAGDTVKLSACGGGGTDFRPVFDAINSEDPPACLVYLTDLYGPAPEMEPDYPVLWASTSRENGPWGETVYVGG